MTPEPFIFIVFSIPLILGLIPRIGSSDSQFPFSRCRLTPSGTTRTGWQESPMSPQARSGSVLNGCSRK